jgi:hypothetical protein
MLGGNAKCPGFSRGRRDGSRITSGWSIPSSSYARGNSHSENMMMYWLTASSAPAAQPSINSTSRMTIGGAPIWLIARTDPNLVGLVAAIGHSSILTRPSKRTVVALGTATTRFEDRYEAIKLP